VAEVAEWVCPRPAGRIVFGHVFRALEQDVPFTECLDSQRNTCPISKRCILKRALADALEAFHASIGAVTSTDLVGDDEQLKALLSLRAELPPSCQEAVQPRTAIQFASDDARP
jgi:Rrf2 family transcriptional regulator, nitric oxide-sensitive transcriptional repressor